MISLSLREKIDVYSYNPDPRYQYLSMVHFKIDLFFKRRLEKDEIFDSKEIKSIIVDKLTNHFLTLSQSVVVDYKGTLLSLQVLESEVVDIDQVIKEGSPQQKKTRGNKRNF